MLGGTFDPPHLGHLIVASEARWQLGLDRVLLVPAGAPPHKPGGAHLPAELRGRLVERAVAGQPGLALSRIELDRDGPSFTADTLEALGRAEPGAKLWFILGADQLEALPGWHAPERILRAARLAVAPRGEAAESDARRLAERLAPGRAELVRMPRIDISSSLVRERLARRQPVRWLVPPSVEAALRDEGLVASDG